MKTIKLLSILFAVSLLAISCSKDNTKNEVDPNAPVEVRFTSGINVTTKAYNNTWLNSDIIGIYMISSGSVLSDENIIEDTKNRLYRTIVPNLGEFTPYNGSDIYYPQNGDTVDFIAYHSGDNNLIASDSYIYPINAKDQRWRNLDFLYSNNAVNKSKTNANVPLIFDHMLAQVTFTVVAGEGVNLSDIIDNSTIISLKNIYREANFNLTNKALTTTGEQTDEVVFLKTPDTAFFEAIIIPQTTTGKVVECRLKGADFFTWTIDRDFESGKKYEYTVTLNRTGVNITGSISDWEPVNALDVELN